MQANIKIDELFRDVKLRKEKGDEGTKENRFARGTFEFGRSIIKKEK